MLVFGRVLWGAMSKLSQVPIIPGMSGILRIPPIRHIPYLFGCRYMITCVYIYIYIYIYIYLFTHVSIYIHLNIHIYIYTFICTYIYIFIYTYYTYSIKLGSCPRPGFQSSRIPQIALELGPSTNPLVGVGGQFSSNFQHTFKGQLGVPLTV